MFKKCSECNKVVWPGQKSKMSFSPIHISCHQKSLSKSILKNPELKDMYLAEIKDWEIKIGSKSGLVID